MTEPEQPTPIDPAPRRPRHAAPEPPSLHENLANLTVPELLGGGVMRDEATPDASASGASAGAAGAGADGAAPAPPAPPQAQERDVVSESIAVADDPNRTDISVDPYEHFDGKDFKKAPDYGVYAAAVDVADAEKQSDALVASAHRHQEEIHSADELNASEASGASAGDGNADLAYGAKASDFGADYNPYLFGKPEPEAPKQDPAQAAAAQQGQQPNGAAAQNGNGNGGNFFNPFGFGGPVNGQNGQNPQNNGQQGQYGANGNPNASNGQNGGYQGWPFFNPYGFGNPNGQGMPNGQNEQNNGQPYGQPYNPQAGFNGQQYGNGQYGPNGQPADGHTPRYIGRVDVNDPNQNPLYGHWDSNSIIAFIFALLLPLPIFPAIIGGIGMWRTKTFHMKGWGLALAAVIINVLYTIFYFWMMKNGVSSSDLYSQMMQMLQQYENGGGTQA